MDNIVNPLNELEQLQELNNKLSILLAGKKAQVSVDVAEGKINLSKAVEQNKEIDGVVEQIKELLKTNKSVVVIMEDC